MKIKYFLLIFITTLSFNSLATDTRQYNSMVKTVIDYYEKSIRCSYKSECVKVCLTDKQNNNINKLYTIKNYGETATFIKMAERANGINTGKYLCRDNNRSAQ